MSKELDMMSGLNSYDYGARQYYSVVLAWDRIDRYAEKYYNIFPYAYCHNNPVNMIDPNGEIELPDNVLWALNYNFDNVTVDAIQSQLADLPDNVDLSKYCIGFEISGTAYCGKGYVSRL